MATANELQRLATNWNGVIKHIYPTIDVIVKGDPDSVESLLSVWETGNPTFTKPTEPELLAALVMVESSIDDETVLAAIEAGAENQAAAIPNFASWTEAEMLTWIDTNIGDIPIDAITNLAEAKALMKKQATAIRAITRFTVAFRNKLFPALQDET